MVAKSVQCNKIAHSGLQYYALEGHSGADNCLRKRRIVREGGTPGLSAVGFSPNGFVEISCS
jgi:hypothetical protein